MLYDYCIEEIEIHYEALVRKKARDRKYDAIMIRTAMNADKKGFKRYVTELDDTWRRIELNQGRAISKTENLFAGLNRLGSKQGAQKGK